MLKYDTITTCGRSHSHSLHEGSKNSRSLAVNAFLRPIHTAQTNANKLVCWSLLDQCVTTVGVGWSLFSLLMNMLIDIRSSIFSPISESWSVSVGAV